MSLVLCIGCGLLLLAVLTLVLLLPSPSQPSPAMHCVESAEPSDEDPDWTRMLQEAREEAREANAERSPPAVSLAEHMPPHAPSPGSPRRSCVPWRAGNRRWSSNLGATITSEGTLTMSERLGRFTMTKGTRGTQNLRSREEFMRGLVSSAPRPSRYMVPIS